MAKVKLSLTINNQSIKTIEELQGNFEPFAVLGLFKSGRLKQWAISRGYLIEQGQLASLELEQASLNQDEIIQRLIEIFAVQTNFSGTKSSQKHLVRSTSAVNVTNFKAMHDQYTSLVERLRRYSNPKDASTDLLNQAKAEDPVAQFNVGRMYLYGEIFEQDYGLARRWLERSLCHNVILSKTFLGKMFKEGLGVNKNYFKAVELFKEPADKGDLLSQVELGLMYYLEEGIGQNHAEAFKWFNKAALQDDPTAQSLLGLLYLRGHGVNKSDLQAFTWFKKAASHGNVVALHNLGCMYLFGIEVHADIKQAKELFKKAAAQGHIESKQALILLEKGQATASSCSQHSLQGPQILLPSTSIKGRALVRR